MNRTRRSHPAFSLIELVVVLMLMALIASVATVSLRGYVVRGRLARAAEIVEQFDLAMRRQARRRRMPVTGIIQPVSRSLVIQATDSSGRTFQLPRQVNVASVIVQKVSSTDQSRQLPVGNDGSSPSYAMKLSVGDASRWVFVSGGSGQMVHGLPTDRINALLELP